MSLGPSENRKPEWRQPCRKVALVLTRTEPHHEDGNRYKAALRALRPGIVTAAGISAVISVLMLTGSIYMLQVYDRVLASGSVPTLMGIFLIVVVLYAFLGYFDFLRSRILSRVAMRLDCDLGLPAFKSWLDPTAPRGQPLREIDMLRGFLSGPAMPGLFDLPWVPLYLAVLFMVHPWLGWLTIAGAAVVAGLAWLGHSLTQTLIARSLVQDASARDFVDRSQRNAEMILAMGMLGHVGRRWRHLHEAGLAASQRASNPAEVIGATSRAFRMLMQSAILTLGAYLVIEGQMSGGMIIASSILTGRALSPVDQVIGQWRAIGKAQEAHRRLKQFFDTGHGSVPAVELPAPTGQISVRQLLKFAPEHAGLPAHVQDRPRLLEGITFDLFPGDAMGVVGASGAGKSTLARLLAGAMIPDGGEIRLDGATRMQWDPAVLGRHVGYLPQQVDLLPGTLRDNIARFDPALTDADVMNAALQAGVHELILRLPDGYSTRVGGMGEAVPLSGGQVQRIGLARALCGNPRLVILDEPNSNLDSAGETCLTQAITGLRQSGAVVIVMAHRPNVLLATNKLLLLEAGRMVEFGDRDALLVRSPAAEKPAVAPMADPAGTEDTPPRTRPPGASPDMLRRARVQGTEPRPGGIFKRVN